jgi:hypothetical protein
MTTKMKTPKRPDPGWSHWRLILWSLGGWELPVSSVIASAFLVVWIVAGPFPPENLLFVPVVALAGTFVAISLTMWATLASQLRGTDYGKLVHIVDQSQDELRAPYEISVGLSFAALLVSGFASLLADVLDSRLQQAVMVMVVSFFVAWAFLAVVSTAVRNFRHHRRISQVESLREQMDADERRFRREQQREGEGASE